MSISCPNCGVEIVGVVIGSAPFPGWRNADANGEQSVVQTSVQSGANPGIAQGSKNLDLDPSPKKTKTYNQGYNAQFREFWKAVPLKRGKLKAQSAWRKAVQTLVQMEGQTEAQSEAQILAGMMRYRNDPNRRDEYTLHPATWLNAGGWEDEPLPSRLPRGIEPAAPKPMTDADYRALLDRGQP